MPEMFVEKYEDDESNKTIVSDDHEHLRLLADAWKTADLEVWLSDKNNLDFLFRFFRKKHYINYETNF